MIPTTKCARVRSTKMSLRKCSFVTYVTQHGTWTASSHPMMIPPGKSQAALRHLCLPSPIFEKRKKSQPPLISVLSLSPGLPSERCPPAPLQSNIPIRQRGPKFSKVARHATKPSLVTGLATERLGPSTSLPLVSRSLPRIFLDFDFY